MFLPVERNKKYQRLSSNELKILKDQEAQLLKIISANKTIVNTKPGGGSVDVSTGRKKQEVPALLEGAGISDLGISDSLRMENELITEELTNINSKFIDFSMEVSESVSAAASNVLAGFGTMIAGLANGSLTMADVGGGLLKIIGDMAVQLGEAAIKIGIGMFAIKAAFKNPFTAIAAGIALVAIGTLISSAGSISSGDAGAFEHGGMVGGSSFSGDKLFARVNSGEMILNNRQQGNLSKMISPVSQMVDIVLGGQITADAGKLKFALDSYDNRKNRTR